MQTVVLAVNAFDIDTWETHEVDDVRDFLMERYSQFPETGRIYHNNVCVANDVTPTDERGIEQLAELDGIIYVVIYPAGPIALLIITAVVAVVTIAAMLFLRPSATIRNTQSTSPNNALSDRQNTARLNARIPDIYGTIRATPDLIMLPYKVFVNNQEAEVSYMCVGRGAFNIVDVYDGQTLVSSIGGTSVEVFGPNTSPNSGTAQLTLGSAITYPILSVARSNNVDGQTLAPPNGGRSFTSASGVSFVYPNIVNVPTSYYIDLTEYFSVGDQVTLTGGACTSSGHPNIDLSTPFSGGVPTYTYTVSAVSAHQLQFSSPSSSNTDWGSNLNGYPSHTATPTGSVTIASTGQGWIGPFLISLVGMNQLICNFIADQGMYLDDGTNQYATSVQIELGVTPCDSSGTATGSEQYFEAYVVGSATNKDIKATTLNATPSPAINGYAKVRARRVTPKNTSFSGNVVDLVKWRDCYGAAPVTQAHFGNVTTVRAVTFATANALSIKERKLNMLVQRLIPISTVSTTLAYSSDVDKIIFAMALDSYIGNRTTAEIDATGISTTIGAVKTYFGCNDAAQFSYTFDNDNLSFEEMIQITAQSAFCTAYRRGTQIKLAFEQQTSNSTLLFNHRNKIPNTETRTVTFGNANDYDGVEYNYIDPTPGNFDAIKTLYIPSDKSATNPQKIDSVGTRSDRLAWFHAYRIWNKIKYGNIAVSFDATQEAVLMVINDRILVADNTRPDTQDGEVIGTSGLEIFLSQNVTLTGDTFHIFLQHYDGTVESILVSAGSHSNSVILSTAPLLALVTDDNVFAKTTYILVGNSSSRKSAFLMTKRTAKDNFTYSIEAINYDNRYYQNDGDYIAGLIS